MTFAEQLKDVDGSCRDINFNDVDKKNAISLLNYVKNNSNSFSATDENGATKNIDEISEIIQRNTQFSIFMSWVSNQLIKKLQMMYYGENNSKVSVEITFFPDDIIPTSLSFDDFWNWLKPILVTVDAKEYFVRYENASWEYGDLRKNSGVIFSHLDKKIDG